MNKSDFIVAFSSATGGGTTGRNTSILLVNGLSSVVSVWFLSV